MNAPLANYLFQEGLYTFNTPMVIILPKSWESYSVEAHKLLDKILTSVKVDINAVKILVLPAVDLSLLHIYSPARVLIFGAEMTDNIGLYESTAAQGFIVIRADDLNLLDDHKKKSLWIALRQMFGL